MADRTIKYLKLDVLRGNPENPKGHDGELIGQSLDRFGLVEPQTLDGRTGLLVAGHGRLEELVAKQNAGEPAPEGIRTRHGKWFVPVVHGWESANDEEALAYLVASNETTIAGGWVNPMLAETLEQIRTTDLGLLGTGYTTARLDLLLSEIQQHDFDPTAGGTDPAMEWVGMPEFDQPSIEGAYAITVHFLTDEDADLFAREKLGLAEKRRQTWWPEHDGHVGSDQSVSYIAAD